MGERKTVGRTGTGREIKGGLSPLSSTWMILTDHFNRLLAPDIQDPLDCSQTPTALDH